MIESLLLSAAHINTFKGNEALTNATGFFFERDDRLFLVTSRHVLYDEPGNHFPDRIEIDFHVDEKNVTDTVGYSIPLYQQESRVWRQAVDAAGEVDVATIEIDRPAMPANAVYSAFRTDNMLADNHEVEVGTSLLIVGFPLGFHDTLHHLPVARHGTTASSFDLRFQGKGYFLTDARTHRGMSGAPVVMKNGGTQQLEVPWVLLGIHSARLDVGPRDVEVDEALGLNCAWFADILMTLTE